MSMSISTPAPTDDSPLPGARPADIRQRRAGQVRDARDWLADEVPVALSFNGVSQAVMLATPLDLEDFALGFALTEGLIADRSELFGAEEEALEGGIALELTVSAACEARLKLRRRQMAGRTGCGLCGTERLDQVRLPLPRFDDGIVIDDHAVARSLKSLHAGQPLQHVTGAVHAAAWCGPDGEALIVREDVGRHNALDKLIGAMLRAGVDASQGFVCVTSRASFEMVQKTAIAGARTLVAVSAPTALARDTALQCGLCLVGFARGDDLVAYAHAERIRFHVTP